MSSDSEDWEALANDDQDVDTILQIKTDHAEQSQVPTQVKPEPKQEPVPTKKKKKLGQDWDRKYQQRKVEKQLEDPLEQKLRRRQLEEEADHELTQELFHKPKVAQLVTEQDYSDFADEVVQKLKEGETHYKLPVFCKQLMQGITDLMESKHLDEILRQMKILHTAKIKQEKGPMKKGKQKNQLKGVSKRGNLMEYDDFEREDDYDEFEDFM